MISTLEKLGLSEKEAKVYLAALELAQDTVQNIAKKAGVNRPTAYFILEKLMQLGLISTLEKGKKTLFVAENPKELEHLLEDEEKEIQNRKQELKDSMNQLTAIYNAQQGKPVVKYFEGVDGLEAMDRYGRDQITKNPEMMTVSPIDLVEKYFPERRKTSLQERIKAGIKSKAIYTRENGELGEFENKAELRQGICVPRDKYPFNATITIYPNWGVKLYYFDENKPYGVVIEDPNIAKNFKLFFELAWQGAKDKK